MATTKSPQLDNPSDSGKGFMLLIVGLLVIGLAGVAFFVTSRETAPTGDAQAPVEIDGEAVPAFPLNSGVSTDPTADPAIGMTFPTMSGTDFNDQATAIENDGRPKAVYFLAHWCPHCGRELPQVVGLMQDGAVPEGMDIYAVNTDYRPESGNPPSRWFYNEEFEGPIIRDAEGSPLFSAAGGRGFPYAVFLDADNQVIARSSGELDPATTQAMWSLAANGSLVEAEAG